MGTSRAGFPAALVLVVGAGRRDTQRFPIDVEDTGWASTTYGGTDEKSCLSSTDVAAAFWSLIST